jgi:hypothetical protein
MKISLKYYERSSCIDGCCYTSGYDVFVDDNKIGSIRDDAQELVELLNETFKTNKIWN